MKQTVAHFEEIAAKAIDLHRSGKLREAAAAYRELLALAPRHPSILHNLGVIAAAAGDHRSAIGYFDQAVSADPGYIAAWISRATAQQALGATNTAIQSYERACKLDPGNYQAHRALGFLHLAQGETGRSLDHFARTYELRRGEDRTGMAAKSLTHATRDKLVHDREQFRFLSLHGRDRPRFAKLAETYETVARNFPEELAELTAEQRAILGEDYNQPLHLVDAPELPDGVLAPRPDKSAIATAFAPSKPWAVVLDDFLTPQALESLRRFLLHSTVWHDFTHIKGFVASYLEDGLACPLLLQIADEIRRIFPDILADHPLSQAWAFKGLHSFSTIGAHSDDAVASVNFWVTPNEANLQPGGSGLTVCLEAPPATWKMADYDSDERRSAAFLEQHKSKSLHVPYRENRAVMFHSRLLHRSEAPQFADGYENHRINLTLLYGTPNPDGN